MRGRPIGSKTRYRYHLDGMEFEEARSYISLCKLLRIQFLRMGFTTKCVKSYSLDNLFMTDEARVVMIKAALNHELRKIEVVIA